MMGANDLPAHDAIKAFAIAIRVRVVFCPEIEMLLRPALRLHCGARAGKLHSDSLDDAFTISGRAQKRSTIPVVERGKDFADQHLGRLTVCINPNQFAGWLHGGFPLSVICKNVSNCYLITGEKSQDDFCFL